MKVLVLDNVSEKAVAVLREKGLMPRFPRRYPRRTDCENPGPMTG